MYLNRDLGGARFGWDETGRDQACRENNNYACAIIASA